MKDGVYFNLPEDDYHRIERLSASGIQNMLISPATFWAKSWLNPSRDTEDKPHQAIGRAYHTARFEPHLLEARFARQLEKEDMPDGALLTDADIKAALKGLGLAQSKEGEGVLQRGQRLLEADPAHTVWHVELDAWEMKLGDRAAIPAKAWAEITEDAKRLRSMPEVAEHLTNGCAEVTILWTDAASGVPMKSRLDYLRPNSFTDLKTFENSRGMQLHQAIANAFRYNRYYVQAALYWQATQAIRAGVLTLQGDFTPEQEALFLQVKTSPAPLAVWYVFQEKQGIPNVLAQRFVIRNLHRSTELHSPEEQLAVMQEMYGDETLIYKKAAASIQWAQQTFLKMREIYADGEPWFPIRAIGRIDDDSFNLNWLESDN